MGASFDLPEPEVFTTGTVGEPGRRVFFLQARDAATIVTLKCEKQQVGALAEYLDGMLDDLPTVEPSAVPTTLELIEPLEPEWAIGTLAVAWDESSDRMVLVAEELVPEEEADEPDDDDLEGLSHLAAGGLQPGDDSPRGRARFRLTREQVAAFVEQARAVVAGGRPPCPFCGGPIDPEGHPCPRMN